MTPDQAGKPATAAHGTEQSASCGGCSSTWTGFRPAHCAECHQTFSGVSLFDEHRARGRCLDPATLVHRGTWQRLMFFRHGMWCGPAMSDEAKHVLRGDT